MSDPTSPNPDEFDWQAARQTLVDQMHENRMHAFDSVRTYGQNAVKGMFLLNAGASIALLTLLGSLISKADANSTILVFGLIDDTSAALIFFAAGMVFSVATSAIGYFNYQHWAAFFWEPREAFAWSTGGKVERDLSRPLPKIRWTAWFGVGLLACSAAAFLSGSWQVRAALNELSAGMAKAAASASTKPPG